MTGRILLLWLLAGASGCLSPIWGVLPGDGWTAVDPEAAILLEASTRLDDAPALTPHLQLATVGGDPIALSVLWSREEPFTLRLIPDAPLAPDTQFRLILSTEALGGRHASQPGIRSLPEPRTITFSTRSALAWIGAAACAPSRRDVVAMTSEPLTTPPTLLQDDQPVPVRWAAAPTQPRLWRGRLEEDPEGPITGLSVRSPALTTPEPAPCDAEAASTLEDAAFGRSRLE